MIIEKEFLCLKEAATILGISQRTMKQILMNNEKIHFTKLNGKILINKRKLLQYFDENDTVKS